MRRTTTAVTSTHIIDIHDVLVLMETFRTGGSLVCRTKSDRTDADGPQGPEGGGILRLDRREELVGNTPGRDGQGVHRELSP
jgi:hypothetical protein